MSYKQSFTNRYDLLDQMRADNTLEWDLIIIGGGITGAGVLREAVRRGYKAILLEQNDFAWGTSSRSSKMIHGGLRYLSAGDIKLTRHSLTERERLLKEAPGLIDRMGYFFTFRKGVFPGRWVFTILLLVYDFIAGIRNHRFYSIKELLKTFVGLNQHELIGASYYTDAVTEDARLVLRVLQDSVAEGAQVLNYAKVTDLIIENGQTRGVVISDEIAGAQTPQTTSADSPRIKLRAPVVINATGAWADRLRNQVNAEKRVRPLRGSHLVIPHTRLPVTDVLSMMHPEDKRGVFIYPWEGATAIGTTDIDHDQNLDIEASISNQEVDYLIDMVNYQFPDLALSRQDVLSTWAGVRPVIGSEKSKDPSKERRDHAVWSDNRLITVSGGKLTTFRLIALDVIALAKEYLPAEKAFEHDRVFAEPKINAKELSPNKPDWGQRILGHYGVLAKAVLDRASENEKSFIGDSLFTLAECRWALKNESVCHIDDLLLRRTRLGLLLPNGGESLFTELKDMFKQELGWNEQTWADELKRYQTIYAQYYSVPEQEK